MSLSIFVRRPVFALMINLAIVVVGTLCYFTLGVDLMPRVNFPVVTVTIQLAGASPEVMENQVTRVVEDAVSVIGGLDHITSSSKMGFSSTVIWFQLNKDINVAVQEVRDKVSAAMNNLPRDILTPIIDKVDTNARPVISIVLAGQMDVRELTQFVKDKVKDSLQSIDGVSQVNIIGGQARQVNLQIDAAKLQAYGVSVTDVRNAVSAQNQESGGGELRSRLFSLNLRTMGLLTRVPQFNEVVVKVVRGVPILLSDVGTAVDGTEDLTSISRLDDAPALSMEVVKSSDANAVRVIAAVKERMAEISATLPPGVSWRFAQDQSVFITDSVHDILEHLVLGSLLAGAMTLLFLGSMRATLIALVAIPCSVIGGFIVMAVFGYTLNQITLLALALVVGIVIDDAVVVLEEIERILEEEPISPTEAAEKGIQTIGFAVMATTLSLVVIFLPIAFMPGILGRYFSCYGVVMATTILLSMVVSFTLTPMMCSRILKHKPPKDPAKKARFSFYDFFLLAPYTALLHLTLRFRFVVILLCVGVCWWGVTLYKSTGQGFVTAQDEDTVSIKIKAPKGRSIYEIDRLIRQISKEVRGSVKDLDYTYSKVGGAAATGEGSNEASIFVNLKPWEERKKKSPAYTVFNAVPICRAIVARYPELRSTVSTTGDSDFQCVLNGPDLAVLNNTASRLIGTLKKTPGFVDLDTDTDTQSPEVRVHVDRILAGRLSVNPLDAASTVQAMVGGVKVSSYFEGKNRYDVYVRLKPEQREWAEIVARLTVPTADGTLLPMQNVTRMEFGLGAGSIQHYNRQRQITVQANLEGIALGDAMTAGQKLVADMKLPSTYTVAWTGNGQFMGPALLAFLVAFLVSVVFMYMVLASQFESLVDPMVILTTLPLCFPFALYSLQVSHNVLDIFSTLGLFVLIGVVKKNAIFQLDATNHLLGSKRPLYESIIEANRIRLRPILMTTVTLVVAMYPVAAAGANGWSRAPMAIVIVGGQALALLLTLLVVPALSSYTHDFRGRKYREEYGAKKKGQTADAAAADAGAEAPVVGASATERAVDAPVADAGGTDHAVEAPEADAAGAEVADEAPAVGGAAGDASSAPPANKTVAVKRSRGETRKLPRTPPPSDSSGGAAS